MKKNILMTIVVTMLFTHMNATASELKPPDGSSPFHRIEFFAAGYIIEKFIVPSGEGCELVSIESNSMSKPGLLSFVISDIPASEGVDPTVLCQSNEETFISSSNEGETILINFEDFCPASLNSLSTGKGIMIAVSYIQENMEVFSVPVSPGGIEIGHNELIGAGYQTNSEIGYTAFKPVWNCSACTESNIPPIFNKGSDATVNEDSEEQIIPAWATGISAGSSDESGQILTFQLSTDNNNLFADGPKIDSVTGNLSYTPAPDTYGTAVVTVTLQDNGGIECGGSDTSIDQSFLITINPVNDVPEFTKGSDQTIYENEGTQMVTQWATNISVGPDNEFGQNLTFHLTTDNDALFTEMPAIEPATGNLSYTTASDAYGTAIVTIMLKDDGGVDNNGSDTGNPQMFNINIIKKESLSFTKGPDQIINEDSEPQIIEAWATNVSSGSATGLLFEIMTDNDLLFQDVPKIGMATGTLTYTPASDAYGTAAVTVTLKTDGSNSNEGVENSDSQTFNIIVKQVNDAPVFTKGPDQKPEKDSGSQLIPGWATGIIAGPDNESEQILAFHLTTDNDTLFDAMPEIDPFTGNLTYSLVTNACGRTKVSVTLNENGGTENGGFDTGESQDFYIIQELFGDIDNNGIVELHDAIFGLKVLSGISSDNICLGSDVNGDSRIGNEEIIYILQQLSEVMK